MNKKQTLKDIIINNTDDIILSIVNLIDYKIIHEDLDEAEAIIETLEYLQTIMPVYGVSADKEFSNDLLELIRIKYEDYKIIKKLSR